MGVFTESIISYRLHSKKQQMQMCKNFIYPLEIYRIWNIILLLDLFNQDGCLMKVERLAYE